MLNISQTLQENCGPTGAQTADEQALSLVETRIEDKLDNSENKIRLLCDLAGWPLISAWSKTQTCTDLLDDLEQIEVRDKMLAHKNRLKRCIQSYLPASVDRDALDKELVHRTGIEVLADLLSNVDAHPSMSRKLCGGKEAFGLFEPGTKQNFAAGGQTWEYRPIQILAKAWIERLRSGDTPQQANTAMLSDEDRFRTLLDNSRDADGKYCKLGQHPLHAGQKALDAWSVHYETLIADAPLVLLGWHPTPMCEWGYRETDMGTTVMAIDWAASGNRKIAACHPTVAQYVTNQYGPRFAYLLTEHVPLADTPTKEELEAACALWEPENSNTPYHDIGKALQAAKLL